MFENDGAAFPLKDVTFVELLKGSQAADWSTKLGDGEVQPDEVLYMVTTAQNAQFVLSYDDGRRLREQLYDYYRRDA